MNRFNGAFDIAVIASKHISRVSDKVLRALSVADVDAGQNTDSDDVMMPRPLAYDTPATVCLYAST